MKVVTVVGTRPNFVKEYFINKELKLNKIEEILVHTGQHYDYEMSKSFFEEFLLPEPNYFLDVVNSSPLKFIAKAMDLLEDVIKIEKPDIVISYGDVNSTSAAAITSSNLNIPFIHIEGGIRSDVLYNPEEINRRISDVLAKLIFCCTKTDIENLKKENIEEDRICLSGDLMYDTLLYTKEHLGIENRDEGYILVTLHRQENVDNCDRLSLIVNALIDSKKDIIFPVHPRTEKRLKAFNFWDRLNSISNIKIVKPQKYSDFIKLIAHSSKVVTDSGGVRRESYLLGKPCIVPINIVWFPEIVDTGWMKIVDNDYDKLIDALNNLSPDTERPNIFGNGRAHKKIIAEILERFS